MSWGISKEEGSSWSDERKNTDRNQKGKREVEQSRVLGKRGEWERSVSP